MAKHDMPDKVEIVEKEIEVIPVEQRAKVRRQSALEAIMDDMTDTFIHDILIPAISDFGLKVLHSVTGAINAYGEEAITGKKVDKRKMIRESNGSSRPSYSDAYKHYSDFGKTAAERNTLDGSAKGPTVIVASRSTAPDVNQVVFQDREKAEQVLYHLMDLARKWGWARVDDFYTHQNVGIKASEQDIYFGWDVPTLASASIKRTHHGYFISLPLAEPIPEEDRS